MSTHNRRSAPLGGGHTVAKPKTEDQLLKTSEWLQRNMEYYQGQVKKFEEWTRENDAALAGLSKVEGK
jgi:hypothetical protein